MIRNLTLSDRASLIRLARALPQGSEPRRTLLRGLGKTAGALTPKQAADLGVTFQVRKSGSEVKVEALWGEETIGEIEAHKVTGIPCENNRGYTGFQVVWAQSLSRVSGIRNLGPLLYDIMLDLVYPHPLMSDRAEVSPDAFRIWTYYLKNRPDIEHFQLDDPENSLTDNPDDNCWQISSQNWGGRDWAVTPLSKAYFRKNGGTPILDECRKLGILFF